MAVRALFALSFASLLLIGGEAATFTITNNCKKTIWPAALTGAGSKPSTTGFELGAGQTNTINIPAPSSGRIWARTNCAATCLTGECGKGGGQCAGAGGNPPVTLIEFTLGDKDGKDTYDISNVDGFNLPVDIVPQGAACPSASCKADINAGCPADLQVKAPDGYIVGCKSDCAAFNKPEDCCQGAFDDPNKCKPSRSAQYFEQKCPQAYSYAYDDRTSTFTCPTGPNYKITYCPASKFTHTQYYQLLSLFSL